MERTTDFLRVEKMSEKTKIRILVAKPGLDAHDRGILVLCKALRDAGMDVIYSGLLPTPEQVAKIAIDEDVDAIALSLHNGAHLTAFPEVKKQLENKGVNDIAIIGGGIIPKEDKNELENQGISGNFGPGTSMETIIDHINKSIKK